MNIIPAHAGEQVRIVRQLFLEYAQSLPIDLCFQGFERELNELPGSYAPPDGRLLIASVNVVAAGCVALRKITPRICEMKRLYVRREFRGKGLGRLLAEAAIEAARESGYELLRLDTLPSMDEAISLYKSLGFQPIEPYYPDPTGSAVFMELALKKLHDR